MIRKGLAIIIILLFVGTCIIPTIAQKSEKQVTSIPRGNWLYVGGSGPGNYTKIQDAINSSSDGDTVLVYDNSSPYYESLIINKSITLKGENKNTTIIDGTISNTSLITIESSDIYIGDFTIRNSSPYYWGIFFEIKCNRVSIIDNIIKNNRGAILVCNSHHTNISRNIFIDNYFQGAISLSNSSDNIICGNVISNTTSDDCISLYANSCNNHIYNNKIKNSYMGVFVGFSSDHNKIDANSISNCEYYGIYIYGSSYNEVYSNMISNNTYGIHMGWYVFSNTINGNIISNNLYGICVDPTENSSNNIFYHNNFLNNTQFNAYVYDEYIHKWDNGYPSGGNYWDDYTGEDIFSGPNQNLTGSDGIGDTPYPIPGGEEKDKYPLMEPYGITTLSLGFLGGFLKYYGIIKNIGNTTAFNVSWDIDIEGSFVLFGKHSSGTLSKPLLAGEEVRVPSRFLFGFGSIVITMAIWADNAPYATISIPGKLLLFFIKI